MFVNKIFHPKGSISKFREFGIGAYKIRINEFLPSSILDPKRRPDKNEILRNEILKKMNFNNQLLQFLIFFIHKSIQFNIFAENNMGN